MKYTILAINPGSTSTKIAVYKNKKAVFMKTIRHDSKFISSFDKVIDQYSFRKETIIDALTKEKIALSSLDAIVGRGGMLKPIKSGTYLVNDKMVADVINATRGEHASNLGCVLAKEIADSINKPAFIVDPVSVDEMKDIARYTGMPEIKRQSLFHALNQKAVGLKAAEKLNKNYADLNLIIVHLGGGISVGIHQKGKVIDVNNALDGDGPMSPERSGSVPLGPLYKMAFSGKYTLNDLKRKNYGNGGVVAYLGTNDGLEFEKLINQGNKEAIFIIDVMCYQIAKEIGAAATVLKGNVDAIVLTGGLAYISYIVTSIKESTSFISNILVFPGEDEMEALAFGAQRVLNDEEDYKEYI